MFKLTVQLDRVGRIGHSHRGTHHGRPSSTPQESRPDPCVWDFWRYPCFGRAISCSIAGGKLEHAVGPGPEIYRHIPWSGLLDMQSTCSTWKVWPRHGPVIHAAMTRTINEVEIKERLA